MLTFWYSINFYKFLKSGLLLDFYLKRLVSKFLGKFFYIFSILLGEKYVIEYLFLRLSSFTVYLYYLVIGARKNFSIFFLSFSWIVILSVILLNVLFALGWYTILWIPRLVLAF